VGNHLVWVSNSIP